MKKYFFLIIKNNLEVSQKGKKIKLAKFLNF